MLTDPVLRVYKQGHTMPLFQNDDWGATSYADEIAATARSAGAFDLAPGSKDSVLLLTLPAGAYTAGVTGANDTTGVALIEVYEIL